MRAAVEVHLPFGLGLRVEAFGLGLTNEVTKEFEVWGSGFEVVG